MKTQAQFVGNDEVEDGVTEELESLVILEKRIVFKGVRTVGEGGNEVCVVFKRITEARLERLECIDGRHVKLPERPRDGVWREYGEL